MRHALLLIVLLLATARAIAAQLPTISIGTLVRVESQAGTVTGRVISQTEDSIIVAFTGAPRTAIATASIVQVGLREGRSHARGAVKGAVIGAAILGVAPGVLILAGSLASGGDAFGALIIPILLGPPGALFGAVIGALVGTERWTTIYSAPPRIGIQPDWNGAPGVRMSIRF